MAVRLWRVKLVNLRWDQFDLLWPVSVLRMHGLQHAPSPGSSMADCTHPQQRVAADGSDAQLVDYLPTVFGRAAAWRMGLEGLGSKHR